MQCFVEMLVEFVNGNVKGIFAKTKVIAPQGLTVFVWIFLMNLMDLILLTLSPSSGKLLDIHSRLRVVPSADVNMAPCPMALACWFLTCSTASGCLRFVKSTDTTFNHPGSHPQLTYP